MYMLSSGITCIYSVCLGIYFFVGEYRGTDKKAGG